MHSSIPLKMGFRVYLSEQQSEVIFFCAITAMETVLASINATNHPVTDVRRSTLLRSSNAENENQRTPTIRPIE